MATDTPIRTGPGSGGDGLTSAEHHELSKRWNALIGAGLKHKKEFKDGYEAATKFAYGGHEFMYEESMPDAIFKATVPKVWEMINIFGPMLAFRNPHRNVRVRYEQQQDPRGQVAKVLQNVLNYHVNELDLNRQMRECVDESMVGAGVMWLEKDPTSDFYGHFHDSALNLVVDPDAETMEDAWWIARRRMMPRWEFAGEIANVAIDDDDLPSQARPALTESINSDVQREGETGEKKKTGKTHDLLVVYEVFSRVGLGWRLKGVDEKFYKKAKSEEGRMMFRHFYVLPTSNRIWAPGEWPVPLWADNQWPCEMLYYRKRADHLWPVPLITPSLGLQKAINWVMTFLWWHLRTTSRDFIVGSNELDETFREAILSGPDLSYVGINTADLDGKSVQDLVGFLQHPNANTDLWRYVEIAQRMFEDSTGLYEALYGQSQTEPRTATADQNRQSRANMRPDDMREVVEMMHTRMARKEAIAAILEYDAEFVGEILGPEAGQVWGEYVEGLGLQRVMREFDFRIEAGSAARPNLQTERDQTLEVFDRLTQLAMQVGDFEALNKLTYNLQRGLNMREADMVQLQPPPPPPQQEQQDPTLEPKMRQEEAKATLAETKVESEIRKMEAEAAKQAAQQGNGAPAAPGEVTAIEQGRPITG